MVIFIWHVVYAIILFIFCTSANVPIQYGFPLHISLLNPSSYMNFIILDNQTLENNETVLGHIPHTRTHAHMLHMPFFIVTRSKFQSMIKEII